MFIGLIAPWTENIYISLFQSGEDFPEVTITPFWRRKMKTLFRRMDTNNDGLLTIDDFHAQAQRIIEKQGFSGMTGMPVAEEIS